MWPFKRHPRMTVEPSQVIFDGPGQKFIFYGLEYTVEEIATSADFVSNRRYLQIRLFVNDEDLYDRI